MAQQLNNSAATKRRGIAEIELVLIMSLLLLIAFLAYGMAKVRLARVDAVTETHRGVFSRATPTVFSFRHAEEYLLDTELPDWVKDVYGMLAGWNQGQAPEVVEFEFRDGYEAPEWLSIADLPNRIVHHHAARAVKVFAGGDRPTMRVAISSDAGAGAVPVWTYPIGLDQWGRRNLRLGDHPVQSWYDTAAEHAVGRGQKSLKLSDEP